MMGHNHLLRHHHRRQLLGELFGNSNNAKAAASTGSSSSNTGSGNSNGDETTKIVASTIRQSSVVQSTVFVTASPTFAGPIGGFSTILPVQSQEQPTSVQQSSEPTVQFTQTEEPTTSAQVLVPTFSSTEQTVAQSSLPTTSLDLSSSILQPTNTAFPTAITTATAASTLLPTYVATRSSSRTTGVSSASTHSSAADASADVHKGLSGGAKVGIVLAVLLAVALAIGAGVWFCVKKKRKDESEEGNEKNPFANTGGPMAGSKAAMRAPRLSLRPMTQFFGNNRVSTFGTPGQKPLPMTGAPAQRNLTVPTGGSAWERRAAEKNPNNPFKDPANPFNDKNRIPSPPQTPTISITPPQASSPAQQPLSVRAPSPSGIGAAVAGAAAAGAAGAALGAKGARGPAPVDVKAANGQAKGGPGSPESSKSLDAAGAAGPGNVHRVQLDFKPSMDDELELCAGQLVRVLHEYDDGWALCTRLDRSQQGVAPRTCLSARPVKPRPANGPPRPGPGPNGAPNGPPNGPPRGPPGPGPNGPPRGPPGPGPNGRMSPAGQHPRPMSPAMRNGPRPASPAQQRPMSPAMMNGPRPASPGMQNGPRPSSPAMRPNGPQNAPRKPSPMGPGAFNQPPRPYSPGPRNGARSQSPGPYGPPGAPNPSTTINQRRRSDSAGVALTAPRGRAQTPSQDFNQQSWRPGKPASPPPTMAPPAPPAQARGNNGMVGQAISSDDAKTMQSALDLQSY